MLTVNWSGLFARVVASVLLAIFALVLVCFGLGAYRVDREDAAFIQDRNWVQIFPQVLTLLGRRAVYQDMDYDRADGLFTTALRTSPVHMEAWVQLAKTAMLRKKRSQKAHRIEDMLGRALSGVTTWKWQEFLLAYELEDEEAFTRIFNVIFERLPHRSMDSCFVASQFWGDWVEIARHLHRDNLPRFIYHCMRRRQTQAALVAWEGLEHPDRKLCLRFAHYLLHQKEMKAAVSVWDQMIEGAPRRVYNGGFEQAPANRAFGWRFRRHGHVALERDVFTRKQGRFALHLTFDGTQNLRFHHVYQILPVIPGDSYTLHFFHRSDEISTDQGVYVEVRGYRCKGLHEQGPMLTGTSDWKEVQVPFQVPKGCKAILLRVRRDESLRLDNKISGQYWLDQVFLTKEGDRGAAMQ